jgi:hypothetical protein
MWLSIRRPAFTARSLTLGTLFNIIFGTLWIGNGLHALESMQTLFLFAALAVVTTTLLAVCLHLFRSMRSFPLRMPADEFQCKNRAMNNATIIQLVGSTILSILLMLVGRSELLLPMIVLSVGLYLLALAPILSLVHYYIVGALLCLLPIGIVMLVPATIPLAGVGTSPGTGWLILVGLIGGSIQFGLASVNLSLMVSLRRRLRTERTLQGVACG